MPTENKLKLNGGEFLLKESLSNEIFTPEDFSEEQLMMKQTIVDFMDREIWPDKMKYEEKNYDLTIILVEDSLWKPADIDKEIELSGKIFRYAKDIQNDLSNTKSYCPEKSQLFKENAPKNSTKKPYRLDPFSHRWIK